MSVDRRAGIVYGWKVTDKERDEMLEHCNWKYEDEFICVNSYEYDPTWVFGEWLATLPEGSISVLDLWSASEKLSSDFNATHKEMLKEMGREDLAKVLSSLYIINQVS